MQEDSFYECYCVLYYLITISDTLKYKLVERELIITMFHATKHIL